VWGYYIVVNVAIRRLNYSVLDFVCLVWLCCCSGCGVLVYGAIIF